MWDCFIVQKWETWLVDLEMCGGLIEIRLHLTPTRFPGRNTQTLPTSKMGAEMNCIHGRIQELPPSNKGAEMKVCVAISHAKDDDDDDDDELYNLCTYILPFLAFL